ncbi:MAG: PIN domain-containing protein [Dehalococcoidia bacterium]|nr:PIN domain-containing protein [Dehalococcoidia bacterium]
MREVTEVVLDASALLVALHGEPGGSLVEPRIDRAAISSINWAEVLQRHVARGIAIGGLRADLEALGLTIVPFSAEDAEAVARLWPNSRSLGLSLGDRACLGLALRLGLPALTADRVWAGLQVGVEVQVVR